MITRLILAVLLQTGALSSISADELPVQNDEDSSVAEQTETLPTIIVRGQRHSLNYEVNSSLSVLSDSEIHTEAPRNPNEVFDRIPGIWVTYGSGQEHLTAIRSPVFTGGGACGAFMVLEDGIPTRPSGFCNMNQLFELNIAQADQIVVLRGPGTVTYGSNAMHGAVDILTPGPSDEPFAEFALEAGTYDYYRGRVSMSGAQAAFQANFTDSGSFRDDESYQHGLVNFQVSHTAGKLTGHTSFAYANLDQDTAGYILGNNSFKDSVLRTQNLNPDASREAWAARVSSRWNWQTSSGNNLEFVPYARSSRMDFLQHFLPGTPLEKNGQDSAGLLFSWSNDGPLTAGIDLEWAEGQLTEFQEGPVVSGSAFLKATRPEGFHYDYEVKASTVAGWVQWKNELRPGLDLTAGLRAEHIEYDYDNRMLDGNTRDDGTVCGFGGCLYTRPADRSDGFSNFSPELGLGFDLGDQDILYIRAARGYRAPQVTELYRLQSGQAVADLDSVTLDSLELGIKGFVEELSYEFTVYAMRKENFIFRDASGYNIDDGKTQHFGLESLLRWQATDELAISANLSWAQHEYDFDRNLARGEIIVKGNEVDTAPPWLGGLQVNWQRDAAKAIEAEWVYQGGYFLDAANAHRYPGHSLLNVRGWMAIADSGHTVSLRLTNLLDDRYAERGDYSFGNYRYFPGAGRRLSVEWQYRH
jgi:iron complex outermembrane receptor protein